MPRNIWWDPEKAIKETYSIFWSDPLLNVEHTVSLNYDCVQLGVSRALGRFCLRGTLSLWHIEQVHAGAMSQRRLKKGHSTAMSVWAQLRRMTTLSKGLAQHEINCCEVHGGQTQPGVTVFMYICHCFVAWVLTQTWGQSSATHWSTSPQNTSVCCNLGTPNLGTMFLCPICPGKNFSEECGTVLLYTAWLVYADWDVRTPGIQSSRRLKCQVTSVT